MDFEVVSSLERFSACLTLGGASVGVSSHMCSETSSGFESLSTEVAGLVGPSMRFQMIEQLLPCLAAHRALGTRE